MPCQRSPSLETLSTQPNDEGMIQNYLSVANCMQEQVHLQELDLNKTPLKYDTTRLVVKHPRGNEAVEVRAAEMCRTSISFEYHSIQVLFVWEGPGEARARWSVACEGIRIHLQPRLHSDDVRLINASETMLYIEGTSETHREVVLQSYDMLLRPGVWRICAGTKFFDMEVCPRRKQATWKSPKGTRKTALEALTPGIYRSCWWRR